MIRKHNYEADLGKKTYRLGMNQFGDLTTEEFAKKVIGKGRRKRRRTKYRSASVFLPPANTRIPDNWDWRQHGGYVTKVKDQVWLCVCNFHLLDFYLEFRVFYRHKNAQLAMPTARLALWKDNITGKLWRVKNFPHNKLLTAATLFIIMIAMVVMWKKHLNTSNPSVASRQASHIRTRLK